MTRASRVERQRVFRKAQRIGFHMMKTPVRHPDDQDFEVYYLIPIGAQQQNVMAARCKGLGGVERVLRETLA